MPHSNMMTQCRHTSPFFTTEKNPSLKLVIYTNQKLVIYICLKDSPSYSTDTCSAISITTLFTIPRKWNKT